MANPLPSPADDRRERGFTLLEVLVALAILALSILSLTALRTDSLVTAAEARNLRVARSIADRIVSEVHAGLLRAYDIRGQTLTDDEMPDFSYKLLLGEATIQAEEAALAEQTADSTGSDSDYRSLERLRWQQQRTDIKRARQLNVPVTDLTTDEIKEPDEPDADTFEDFAVYVYYPALRGEERLTSYSVRSRASTLALSGLTSEQAEERKSRTSGETPPSK